MRRHFETLRDHTLVLAARRVRRLDAAAYMLAQFLGGAAGTCGAATILGSWVAHSSVGYFVTQPGPRIREVVEGLEARGLPPSFTPLGVRLNETEPYLSRGIRCPTCDGYPCLVHAKSDAEVTGVRPAMREPKGGVRSPSGGKISAAFRG